MFNVIERLQPVDGEDFKQQPATTKILFTLLPVLQKAASLSDQGHSPQDVLQLRYVLEETLLRTGDSVRPDVVVEGYQRLMASHPLYAGLNHEVVLNYIREMLEEMVIEGSIAEDTPPSHSVYSVLVPDKAPVSPAARQILEVQDLPAALAALYDLRQEAGVDLQGREVPITPQQWIVQRLANAMTNGPMDRPGLVMAFAHQHVTKRIHSAGDQGRISLTCRPGTTDYHRKVKSDLATMARWNAPPHLHCSISFDPLSELMLATRISHDAGVEGREEQVWSRGSEQRRLTPRPGRDQDPGLLEQTPVFFVHCKTEQQNDSCPFHEFCDRQPAEGRRDR